jgi:hypothetical protein
MCGGVVKLIGALVSIDDKIVKLVGSLEKKDWIVCNVFI